MTRLPAGRKCGFLMLRTGALTIGVVSLVGSLLYPFISSGNDGRAGLNTNWQEGFGTRTRDMKAYIGAMSGVILDGLLIWGAYKGLPLPMIPWIAVAAIGLVVLCLRTLSIISAVTVASSRADEILSSAGGAGGEIPAADRRGNAWLLSAFTATCLGVVTLHCLYLIVATSDRPRRRRSKQPRGWEQDM